MNAPPIVVGRDWITLSYDMSRRCNARVNKTKGHNIDSFEICTQITCPLLLVIDDVYCLSCIEISTAIHNSLHLLFYYFIFIRDAVLYDQLKQFFLSFSIMRFFSRNLLLMFLPLFVCPVLRFFLEFLDILKVFMRSENSSIVSSII